MSIKRPHARGPPADYHETAARTKHHSAVTFTTQPVAGNARRRPLHQVKGCKNRKYTWNLCTQFMCCLTQRSFPACGEFRKESRNRHCDSPHGPTNSGKFVLENTPNRLTGLCPQNSCVAEDRISTPVYDLSNCITDKLLCAQFLQHQDRNEKL